MTSLIQRIGSLAIQIFKRDVKNTSIDISKTDTEELKQLLNLLTINDLKIDPRLINDEEPFHPTLHKAPVTYMQLYQDSDVNICIFFLKNGVKLPLHDHPDMVGLLKVIHGTVSIKSYSMTDKKRHPSDVEKRKELSSLHQAVKHPCVTMRPTDPVCVLQPGISNLHEISSVNGPAAFLDILSPPYGADSRTSVERDCHYYKELSFQLGGQPQKPSDEKDVWLLDIETPREFWCDQADYCGPPVE